jgi:hypothetical protein
MSDKRDMTQRNCRNCLYVSMVAAGTSLVCRWEKANLPPPVFRARLWGKDAPTTYEEWAVSCPHFTTQEPLS